MWCGTLAGSQLDLVDGLFTSLSSTRAGPISLGPVTSKGVQMQASTFPLFLADAFDSVWDIPACIFRIRVSNPELLGAGLLFCASILSSALWSRPSYADYAL